MENNNFSIEEIKIEIKKIKEEIIEKENKLDELIKLVNNECENVDEEEL